MLFQNERYLEVWYDQKRDAIWLRIEKKDFICCIIKVPHNVPKHEREHPFKFDHCLLDTMDIVENTELVRCYLCGETMYNAGIFPDVINETNLVLVDCNNCNYFYYQRIAKDQVEDFLKTLEES